MLDKLLSPKSITIVGAAREEGKVGHIILDNIIKSGYKGAIYPVNPKAKSIHSIKCYSSISSIDKKIDLAVIVTPAKTIPPIILECVKSSIKNIVIISAGFKESSLEGARLENEILQLAKDNNIRILGPNCLGLINAQLNLNASFSKVGPNKGNIAFISQSGALQTAILDISKNNNIGFSKFVSLGNKSDLDETDFINYLDNDKETDVICLYLESVTRGSEFLRAASRIVSKKPIIVLKAGRTNAGARAVSSHTGSLAGSIQAYTTAFSQSGIIQAGSLEELFLFATILSNSKLPRGNRLAILTNAGGPAILASDAAVEASLKIVNLSNRTIRKLSEFLPTASNVYNPVDILGDALSDRYETALSLLIRDINIDCILVILTPQAMTDIKNVAKVIIKSKKISSKLIITSFMGDNETEQSVLLLQKNNIANFTYPEDAVKAISALINYSEIKNNKKEIVPILDVNKRAAQEIIEKYKKNREVNLSYVDANNLLKAYGIKAPDCILAKSSDKALIAAKKIGYPLVLKIVSQEISHKSDIGGVKVGIKNKKELVEEFQNININAKKYMPNAKIDGVLVQEMLEEGEETIVGVNRDPQFGPLVLFGLGGIYVEILKDVSFRIAPLTKKDVKIMISEVKSYLLLKGIRGNKPRDILAIEDVILRVSQLVTDFKNIVEMDINPLMAQDEGRGAYAADVRVSISL